MKNSTTIAIKNFDGLANFLQKTTIELSEVITGFLASDVNDKKLAIGHIVQSIFKGDLLTQVGRELKVFRDKGLIKEDYFATHKQQSTLVEFLKFIDGEDTPDEERFKAMKSIFFYSVSKEATEKTEKDAYEMMQICKQLSSMEILILKAAYDIFTGKAKPTMGAITNTGERRKWLNIIANELGYDFPEIVERHEKHLMELKLISERTGHISPGNGGTIEPTRFFRLTTLGYKLCEYITKYE